MEAVTKALQIQIGAVERYNASFTFKTAVGIISVAMKEIERQLSKSTGDGE